MKVTIFGSGYVGLVTGACLSDVGNHVVCVDIDGAKVARLNAGEIPIYEPGLEPLVKRNVEAGRLRFTTDVPESVRASEIIFIAVGTPPDEDGSADMSHVLNVAETVGRNMNDDKIVVLKSTVPVGTADKVRAEVAAALAAGMAAAGMRAPPGESWSDLFSRVLVEQSTSLPGRRSFLVADLREVSFSARRRRRSSAFSTR